MMLLSLLAAIDIPDPRVLMIDVRIARAKACPIATVDEVTVCARRDPSSNIVAIWVNGVAGRMLIDPGGPTNPTCNSDFAIRARVRGAGPRIISHVGPIAVTGGHGDITFFGPAMRMTRPTRWSDRRAVVDADCTIGPGGLDAPIVRFTLGSPDQTIARSRWRSSNSPAMRMTGR